MSIQYELSLNKLTTPDSYAARVRPRDTTMALAASERGRLPADHRVQIDGGGSASARRWRRGIPTRIQQGGGDSEQGSARTECSAVPSGHPSPLSRENSKNMEKASLHCGKAGWESEKAAAPSQKDDRQSASDSQLLESGYQLSHCHSRLSHCQSQLSHCHPQLYHYRSQLFHYESQLSRCEEQLFRSERAYSASAASPGHFRRRLVTTFSSSPHPSTPHAHRAPRLSQ